ncbi:MAG: PASTA domain-containing protein [Nitrospinae bacterium]|nr:PASTA domain-containing protein [Nitrospinota bacterium]
MPQALKITALMVVTFIIAGLSGFLAMKFVIGGGAVRVPDLVGKELKEAGQLLEEQGLRLKVEGRDYHPLTPKDHIILQRPEANATFKEDREVKVVVSMGQQRIYLPDLKGEKLQRAQLILQQNSLSLQEVVRIHSDRYPAGVIISQTPLPRQEVPTGARIKLLVSQGKRRDGYYLPDFTGKGMEEAKEITSGLGLNPGLIEYEESPASPPGTVIRQTPPSGSRVAPGETIHFVVAQSGAGVPESGKGETLERTIKP